MVYCVPRLAKKINTFLIILVVLFSLTPLFLVSPLAKAQDYWYDTDWGYRKKHIINATSLAGENYQMRFTVHYGSGSDSGETVYLNSHSKTDFSDVRFVNSTDDGLYDIWNMTFYDSDNATFWVEITENLTATDVNMSIYYGNNGASAVSDGSATFPLFDDFDRANSGTVGNSWTEDEDDTGTVSIDSNELKIIQDANEYCHIQKSFPSLSDFAIHVKVKVGANAGATWRPVINAYWSIDDWINIGTRNDGTLNYRTEHSVAGTPQSSINDGSPSTGVFYYYMIRLVSDNAYTDYGTNALSFTNQLTYGSRPASWSGVPSLLIVGKGYGDDPGYPTADWDNSYSTAGSSGTSYLDDVFIRKYVSPEPQHHTWYSEEAAPSPPSANFYLTVYFDTGLIVYVNSSSVNNGSENAYTENATLPVNSVPENTNWEFFGYERQTYNNFTLNNPISIDLIANETVWVYSEIEGEPLLYETVLLFSLLWISLLFFSIFKPNLLLKGGAVIVGFILALDIHSSIATTFGSLLGFAVVCINVGLLVSVLFEK